MNFDLKRSWLGATLVRQGRGFFFSVLVCVWGLYRGGVVVMTTVASPAFRSHIYELTGRSIRLFR